MTLSPEHLLQVIAAIKAGVPRQRALRKVGVSSAQYRRLVIRAANGDASGRSSVVAVEKAETESQQNLIQKIRSSNDWKAHAFILERQFSEEWGQKIQVEVKKELEKVYAIAEEILPEEQFIRLLEGISSFAGETEVSETKEAPSLH